MRVGNFFSKNHALIPVSRHTFGGVQHAPFPDIVPELNDTDNSESVSHFDTTNTHFDNNMCVAVLYQVHPS